MSLERTAASSCRRRARFELQSGFLAGTILAASERRLCVSLGLERECRYARLVGPSRALTGWLRALLLAFADAC